MVATDASTVMSPVQLASAITHEAPTANRLKEGLQRVRELRESTMTPGRRFAVEHLNENQLGIAEAALEKESRIIAEFPTVRLLDTAALKLLLQQEVSNGIPPRLAPFQVNEKEAESRLDVSCTSRVTVNGGRVNNVENTQVAITTNFHSPEMDRVYEEFIHKLVEQAFHSSILDIQNREKPQDGPWDATGTVSAVAKLGEITIPPDAKEVILKAKHSGLFDHIYLLAEAVTWDIKSSASAVENRPARNVDPLVIGEANGKLWVLAVFDLTPHELHIWEEFSAKV